MPIIDNKKNIRSFGRINGRSATKNCVEFLNNELPKFSFDFRENNTELDINKIFNNNNINYFEIGFGYGESVAERAKNTPNINYVACETYTKGITNLIELINKYQLKNIKIFNGDARLLLDKIKNSTIDKIFVLFPDPWPKKRHFKRRIINEDFLNLIKDKLKNDGELFFASDTDNYVLWTIEKISKTQYFKNNFVDIKDCETQPIWWIRTKYQEKAIKERRKSKFLSFILK